MSRTISLLLLVALAGASNARAASPLALDELVAKNIQARGGITALHAMHSLTLRGKLLVNEDQFELGYVQTVAARRYPRRGQHSGHDSNSGLRRSRAGRSTPSRAARTPKHVRRRRQEPRRDRRRLRRRARRLEGKGYKLEYLGTEDVDGTDAHKIRVTRPNGDTSTSISIPDYFLEIRTRSQRIEHGVTDRDRHRLRRLREGRTASTSLLAGIRAERSSRSAKGRS